MRESWLHGQHASIKGAKDILSYMTGLLEAATDAAEAEARKQTQRHKEIYDRQSTVRELAVDDKVLILQPISSFKLLATWSGPYVVTKRLNTFNYEIDMGQRKTVLHINILKRWEERTEEVIVVMLDDETIEEDEKVWQSVDLPTTSQNFKIGEHLSETQVVELQKLLAEFPEVFSDKIGCTDLVEHVIRVTDSKPCVQPPYKVPEALRDEVEREIERQLSEGIIVESDSPYSAPLIVVKKLIIVEFVWFVTGGN